MGSQPLEPIFAIGRIAAEKRSMKGTDHPVETNIVTKEEKDEKRDISMQTKKGIPMQIKTQNSTTDTGPSINA